jgi:hypothetical protein
MTMNKLLVRTTENLCRPWPDCHPSFALSCFVRHGVKKGGSPLSKLVVGAIDDNKVEAHDQDLLETSALKAMVEVAHGRAEKAGHAVFTLGTGWRAMSGASLRNRIRARIRIGWIIDG